MIWKDNNFLIKKKLEKTQAQLVAGEEICEPTINPNQ